MGRLFEPFFQVDEGYARQFQGAGLGLSICNRLVRLMGGDISVESEPDRGTTVRFSITFGRVGPQAAGSGDGETEETP